MAVILEIQDTLHECRRRESEHRYIPPCRYVQKMYFAWKGVNDMATNSMTLDKTLLDQTSVLKDLSITKTTLDKVPVGHTAKVTNIEISGTMRRRLQDLGMIFGTKILPTKKSPSNGPTAYLIRDTVYALRQEDASRIDVDILD